MPPVMPSASPSPSPKPSVDVRTLSLAQLQKLAERGSRRARAELEGRMRATAGAPAPAVRAAVAPAAAAPPDIPTLTVRADAASARPAAPPAVPPRPAASAPDADLPAAPRSRHEALAEQLQAIARQDEARARADGPPRLVGLVLIAWGVLLLLGGLAMLGRGGGGYYLFCGLGSAAVGGLLMRCSRWALALHGVLLLLALAWAWQITRGSGGLALVQAAPLGIAALWMAVRPVREPLQ